MFLEIIFPLSLVRTQLTLVEVRMSRVGGDDVAAEVGLIRRGKGTHFAHVRLPAQVHAGHVSGQVVLGACLELARGAGEGVSSGMHGGYVLLE